MVIVKSGEKRTLDEQMRDLEEVQAAKKHNQWVRSVIKMKAKQKEGKKK